jgi:hypothetical protein
MTIDAGNSLRIIRTIIPTINEPQGIVSTGTGVKKTGYGQRLFFCDQIRLVSPADVHNFMNLGASSPNSNRGRNCQIPAKNVEKLCKWLAFSAKIYYNNTLYNVVGPQVMQGVAGLRKVAEVVVKSFFYLTLPHIANSKGTVVAK